MSHHCKILIVEDDQQIRKLMVTSLTAQGYECLTAIKGEEAILVTTTQNPDLMLLDLGLPDMDGVDIIKNVRGWSNIPIIVVSARSEDNDKIGALDEGADDFLTKTFSVEELMARIRVSERRIAAYAGGQEQKDVFVNGQYRIDYAAGCAYFADKELQLTPIEYKLLCLLSQNVGKVMTHTFITDKIWGNSLESDVASLRVFMASLRKKIEVDTSHPKYIQTHVGIGYRMIRL